ncbi:single-stranded DNA-binding protein [Mycobacterium simiae]|uniref:Single-stranded DNA-binding protein n=1 Tax=Mycobacterium simiae TaxID=1784 RepID=A0A5B1BV28_MYCSI|nr:single-stranded DNA-binding protein [Mycobacterium simiae]KAA1251009.1 single-stranded DNA-binding protein [Mycobacterium simiae]
MFETQLTVVGHIVNDLQRRKVGDQEVVKFRVASNSRRRTSDGGWEPGNSLFITVSCWGRLVTGVGAALGKGAPVIVVGHVYTSEYEDRDGNRRSSLEMRATSVGPDLSRVFVRIEKPSYTGPSPEKVPAPGTTGESAIVVNDEGLAAGVDSVPDVAAVEDAAGDPALPLSA